MAVLPRASDHCIPAAYRDLMAPGSPIEDFYPEKFTMDPK
jgi:5'-3' exonuclease